jgi:putative Mn2+ efflux pump MntP
MNWSFLFFVNSAALGVGLAMDAFSVSLANGLNEPKMKWKRMSAIAGVFAFFQWFMPMLGWIAVHTVVQYFSAFEKAIPWIALGLLGYIGGKMLWEGIEKKEEDDSEKKVGKGTLLIQGIATSIDALSVGFTIANYDMMHAFVASVIIAVVTFAICIGGLILGKKFGMKLANKASILGGVILIAIGLEIFITNLF